MKWGRKRCSSSPSSTHTSPSSSIIDRVFPVSWLSKLKQKGGNNITEATVSLDQMKRGDPHRKLEFPIPNDSLKHGRFYSSDADDYDDGGEAYWRISFGEERIIEGRRSTGGINPLWYNDEFHVPASGFKSSDSSGIQENMMVSDRGEYPNFNDMVLDVKKIKEKKNGEMSNGKSRCDLSLRKLNVQEKQGNFVRRLDFEEDELLKPVERDVSPAVLSPVHDLRQQNKMSYPNFVLSPVQEDISLEATEENRIIASNLEKLSISEWPRFEEDNMKFKEIKVRTETKKKPPRCNDRDHYYSRKPKQNNNKVKTYSPRTECKIRALEEMRKARIKSKRKEKKEDVITDKNVFDSFAVVKSSYNPPKDFRDSMVEMIKEKDIKRPEELEQLLASYLTLNSDEYHNVIIEVFRLVWLEMKDAYRNSRICNCRYCDY